MLLAIFPNCHLQKKKSFLHFACNLEQKWNIFVATCIKKLKLYQLVFHPWDVSPMKDSYQSTVLNSSLINCDLNVMIKQFFTLSLAFTVSGNLSMRNARVSGLFISTERWMGAIPKWSLANTMWSVSIS